MVRTEGSVKNECEQREIFKGKSVRKHKQCRNMMDDLVDSQTAQDQVTFFGWFSTIPPQQPIYIDEYCLQSKHRAQGSRVKVRVLMWCYIITGGNAAFNCGSRAVVFFFQSLQTRLASVCHLSSYWPPTPVDHLGVGCDCTAMFIAPGWPDPIPAKTDMATASAAWTLSPLMVDAGLETEVGGEGPCWMTAAGEPVASAEMSREVSSPPAATDRDRNIHP